MPFLSCSILTALSSSPAILDVAGEQSPCITTSSFPTASGAAASASLIFRSPPPAQHDSQSSATAASRPICPTRIILPITAAATSAASSAMAALPSLQRAASTNSISADSAAAVGAAATASASAGTAPARTIDARAGRPRTCTAAAMHRMAAGDAASLRILTRSGNSSDLSAIAVLTSASGTGDVRIASRTTTPVGPAASSVATTRPRSPATSAVMRAFLASSLTPPADKTAAMASTAILTRPRFSVPSRVR
uniref:Uncharacterized protein n=1 Tax=Triticum urartu TaxID=4572 RepID=A0A8R7P3H1_TRIUA